LPSSGVIVAGTAVGMTICVGVLVGVVLGCGVGRTVLQLRTNTTIRAAINRVAPARIPTLLINLS
jgi:hypothetical protein